jgi:hypothetical protein
VPRAPEGRAQRRSDGHLVTIAALFCIFVGAPLAGTGHVLTLLAFVVVAGLGALLWRPIQAWSAQLEARAANPDAAALEQRVQQLQSLVEALAKQQEQVQETVRWQAQLLQRSAIDAPDARPPRRRARARRGPPFRRRPAGSRRPETRQARMSFSGRDCGRRPNERRLLSPWSSGVAAPASIRAQRGRVVIALG